MREYSVRDGASGAASSANERYVASRDEEGGGWRRTMVRKEGREAGVHGQIRPPRRGSVGEGGYTVDTPGDTGGRAAV